MHCGLLPNNPVQPEQLAKAESEFSVSQAMIKEMAWYDAYLNRGKVDRSANTTPGNKKGGLSNIVEKAMGSIIKSGTAPISAVLSPGEKASTKGLIYAATPASDFICGTLQLAAGMNLHVFTTGRGTPYGLAEVPVIVLDHLSAEQRRAYVLADNKLALNAGWDEELLRLEVASLNLADFDLSLLGWSEDELAGMLDPKGIDEPSKEYEGAQEYGEDEFSEFEHKCPRCGFEFNGDK
jgi:hypothetical protein